MKNKFTKKLGIFPYLEEKKLDLHFVPNLIMPKFFVVNVSAHKILLYRPLSLYWPRARGENLWVMKEHTPLKFCFLPITVS